MIRHIGVRTRGMFVGLAALLGSVAACGEEAVAPPVTPPPALPPIAPEVAAWLDARGHAFEGTHLGLDTEELRFLDDIVGDARIVSLGENTHGTRDFFEMKARILRYLVEEHGFNAFAIEATWPEAWRLDHYVRTGEGDPATLLSGLYFWTWNTESVLEMIEWMREHNASGGDVGFYGVDMQYPGMALHNVREFFELVDPDRSEEVVGLLSCLEIFANGPDGLFPQARYETLDRVDRIACGQRLEAVRTLLVQGRPAYEAATDTEAYQRALHSLRVAVQYHEEVEGLQFRDQSMAENTIWLADHLGTDARIVVWAHNFHVADLLGQQGYYLRRRFGDDMVVMGFTHAAGEFTAVWQNGIEFLGRQPMSLDPVAPLSYEAHLETARAPRYVLDLRNVDTGQPGAEWLAVPRQTRLIGCCYDSNRPWNYWGDMDVPALFDVLIHFDETGPTAVLPMRPPTAF